MVVRGSYNVTEDDVLSWNCTRFLNRLQYLKDQYSAEIAERDAG